MKMREKKIHVKLKGKPVCGARGKKLRFVTDNKPTCLRCIKAVEK
jgi:hypothetical protein